MKRLGIRADDTLIVTWPTAMHMAPARFRPPAKPDDGDDDATLFPVYYRVADPASIIGFEELRDLIISSGSGHRCQILDSRTPRLLFGRQRG
ncbi:hypothetical protein MY4824_001178 [Beauveria thailandica]